MLPNRANLFGRAPIQRTARWLYVGGLGFVNAACAATPASSNLRAPAPAVARSAVGPALRAPLEEPPASASALADAERRLAKEATLPSILRVALANNPELAEARQRVVAQREQVPAASRLPDPELEYQLWGAPLDRPYALGSAQMHMVGVSQTFPAPGSLAAREQAASARTEVAAQAERARKQELMARVRRAYAQYYRAEREYRLHLEHGALTQQALEMTRAAYQGGRGTQQDVLRASVAMSRLHGDLANIDAERHTARGLLNTLMARPAGAALGPPAPIQSDSVQVRFDTLMQRIEERPEIAAAQSAIRAREEEAAASRASGKWPSFMVGVQYMYMPPMEHPHNYGVTLSMSVPWLSSRYREEARAAEAHAAAERSALSSARNAAIYELFEATERLKAARQSLLIIERDLAPQAQRSFESAEAAYRGGQSDTLALFDALSSLLDVRLERERALARAETALVDVERALGGPIATFGSQESK